jgi:hypothetical protein
MAYNKNVNKFVIVFNATSAMAHNAARGGL